MTCNNVLKQFDKRKSLTIPKVVVLERNSDLSLTSSICIKTSEVAEKFKKNLVLSDEASVVSSNCSRSSKNFSIRSFSRENRLEIQRESRDINEILKELNAAGISGRLGKSKMSVIKKCPKSNFDMSKKYSTSSENAFHPSKPEDVHYPSTSYNNWAEEYSFTKEQEEEEVYTQPRKTSLEKILKSDVEKLNVGTDSIGIGKSHVEEDLRNFQYILQNKENDKNDLDLSINKFNSSLSSSSSDISVKNSKSLNEKRIESVKAVIGFSLKRKSSINEKHENDYKYDDKVKNFVEEVKNDYVVDDLYENCSKNNISSGQRLESHLEIESKKDDSHDMKLTDDESSFGSNQIELEASIKAIENKERKFSSSISENNETDEQKNSSSIQKLPDSKYFNIENTSISSESEDEISSEELDLWMEQSFEKNKDLSNLQLHSRQSTSSISSESSSNEYSVGEDGSILV